MAVRLDPTDHSGPAAMAQLAAIGATERIILRVKFSFQPWIARIHAAFSHRLPLNPRKSAVRVTFFIFFTLFSRLIKAVRLATAYIGRRDAICANLEI